MVKRLQDILSGLGSGLSNAMAMVQDRELVSLLDLDYLKNHGLTRKEMLKRFAEGDVDFYVTNADILVPEEQGMTTAGYIQSLDKIVKRMGYSVEFTKHGQGTKKWKWWKWKAPPKNVMEDPNLSLQYSIAPDLFPSYDLRDKIETATDFLTGRKVPDSIFKLWGGIDSTTGEKVIDRGYVGATFVYPSPKHRDEVLKVLKLVKAPYLRICQ